MDQLSFFLHSTFPTKPELLFDEVLDLENHVVSVVLMMQKKNAFSMYFLILFDKYYEGHQRSLKNFFDLCSILAIILDMSC